MSDSYRCCTGMPPSATLIGVLGPSVEQFRQKNPNPLGTASRCPCSPHSVGHSVKIKKYMVTHTRKNYSKGCNICIGNDGFFLGKRLSMGFHRQYVEPADPFELDPPTLKCAIPRFQRGPYYYHRSGRLCKFVTSFANLISAASNL